MTKREIVRSISEQFGLTRLEAAAVVQKVLDSILDTLAEEGRVELRNFGVFDVQRRGPRKARNPRTGERVFVPEKLVVSFKPGQSTLERVRDVGARPS